MRAEFGGVFSMKKRTRQSGNRILGIFLAAAILAGGVSYQAEATSKTQQKINETEQEKKNLENKLDQKQDELEDLKGQHTSLKGQLNNLNIQLTEVSSHLADLEQQITDKEAEIALTQENLEQARVTEEEQYAAMKVRIRYMYENNESNYLEAFFTAGSFSAFINAADSFECLAEYDRSKMDEYTANREYIESEEARLEQEKEQLESLKVETEAEKGRVSGLISQTSNSISKYASQISAAEQEALNYEAEIKKKEEDLEYLKKKLAEEIAMSKRAAKASWKDISEISFAEGDRKVLANIIYCEAGGESYEGKLAVGAVVINRVRCSLYPGSVVGVVYQSGQFSPVASGRMDLALASDKATAACYQAADAAMAGTTNVGNCVYFRTPVEGLTGISIGGHIFY